MNTPESLQQSLLLLQSDARAAEDEFRFNSSRTNYLLWQELERLVNQLEQLIQAYEDLS